MSEVYRNGLALRPGKLLKIGGAHDALSAVLLERAGFPALWVSGFALSAAQFAMPDVNLVSMTESVDATRRMAESVKVPVIVDADNGFGDVNNVMRAVREYGLAGASGICIEDNTFPSDAVFTRALRELISVEEMCQKLTAAKHAALSFNMMLIGRVESLIADLGTEDAMKRANAYAEAGADAVLIHSKKFEPLKQIATSGRLSKPLITVPTLFGETSFREMTSCGIAAVIYANQMLRSMVHSCEPLAKTMLTAESLADLDDSLCTVKEINKLVKVPTDWSEGGQPPSTNRAADHHKSGNGAPVTSEVSAHAR